MSNRPRRRSDLPTFRLPTFASRMFEGFRSRCRMPSAWACWTARAMTATSRAASRGGSGPPSRTLLGERLARRRTPCRGTPARRPMPTSWTVTMFGCFEPGRGLGLGAEPRAVGVGREVRFAHHLQRDEAVEALLPRLVHDAHPAAAEFLEQFEVAELAGQRGRAVRGGVCRRVNDGVSGPAAGEARSVGCLSNTGCGRGARTGRRPTARGVRRRGRGGRGRRRRCRRLGRPAPRRRAGRSGRPDARRGRWS